MDLAILACAGLIFFSILLTPLSARIGAPLLLLFLLIGMLAGEDGPGQVAFDEPEHAEEAVEQHYVGMLTGAYSIAYRRQFVGNEASAKYRAWAVRFVVLALLLLFFAHMLLPVHSAALS